MMSEERRLQIAGRIENIAAACNFVMGAARAAGLDEKAVHHCHLAVDEACTNIIEHGFGSHGADHRIDVRVQHHENIFTIIIEDDSAAFDPTAAPDPDFTSPLEDRQPGGYGIYFIKKLMDSVTYQRQDDHNRLIITKRIPVLPVPPTIEVPALRVEPIKVEVISPRAAIITPSGHFDTLQANDFSATLQAEIAAGRKTLIVDLGAVDYLSSAGMKALVSAWQRTRNVKGELIVCGLRPRVREVLQMIGLDLVFTLVDTPAAAIERINLKK